MPSAEEEYGMSTQGRIIKLFGEKLYEKKVKAFEELVANAYDADATEVRIYIPDDYDTILIIDNGKGMDKEGLNKFFNLGSGWKEKSEVTDNGRRMIGNFGIGKVAASIVADKIEVYTIKDGVLRDVEIDFDEIKDKPFHDVNFTCRPKSPSEVDSDFFDFKPLAGQNPEDAHGTFIALEGITEEVSKADIKKSLRWKMPLRPDFELYINDKKIEERKIEEPEKTFEINEELANAGKVKGEIAYASSSLGEKSGIWIKVNGRVVNEDRNPIDFKGMHAILNRIYAEIEANGLEDAVRLDRESFDKSSKKWKELSEFLESKLRGPVEDYYMKKLQERDIKDFEEAKNEAVSDLEKMLEDMDIDEDVLPIKEKIPDEDEKKEMDEEELKKELIEVDEDEDGGIKRPDSLRGNRSSTERENDSGDSEPSENDSSGRASADEDTGHVAGVFTIGEQEFNVMLWQGGEEGPESTLMEAGLIGINIDHPHFSLCKMEGPLSLKTNIRRAVLLPIAKAQESSEEAFAFFDKLLREADKLLTEEDYEKLGLDIV